MNGEELKRGYYTATIVEWALGVSKEKGTPQFSITFELDGYKASGGRIEDCPSLRRTLFRYITEGTMPFFAKDLLALGYDREDFDGLDPKSSVAFDFAGVKIEVQLKYETYEGKQKERWELAMVKGGIETKPLAEDGLSRLNAEFGQHLKLAKVQGGAPAKPSRPVPAAATGYGAPEDDTPF